MNLTIIGTGYVGLVTAVGFAELGHQVIGVDKDEAKIRKLQQGIPTIYEPGLEELLQKNLHAGRLQFTTDLAQGIQASEILFVCVGTPQLPDGSADLSQVEAVARTIAQHLNGYKLIVEKSTVPVQTAQWIKRTIDLYNKNHPDFDVASNPEFLREGSAVYDFFHPQRIVIGVESDRARQILTDLYQGFDCPLVVTDLCTAELIKHASNSFLALKISYINMIADLCEKVGADVTEVAKGMGLDDRIGP